MANKKVKITLVKSLIGSTEKQRRVAKALGLTKKDQTVEHENSAVIMGMVNAIPHLLKVAE
ncbi:TPA: 50S ribosomal protein L30 [Candidatus Avigastranaerophilus faecigallinarum]|nr:50S ribosomal protein L30 [Candidatus Avigastranaerophilus faecigallinarum]